MTALEKTEEQAYALDRNFALEAVRVTEAAALAAAKWIGLGDEKEADRAAVNAMRQSLNSLSIDGTVVIGEGERDKAPMLYIGEHVGSGEGAKVDIALDPLEGTTICATGGPNSLAVLAMAEHGGFLHAPDVYMEKIAVGAGYEEGIVSLERSVTENIEAVANAKGCPVNEVMVMVLDRDRHAEMIKEVRASGARLTLIGDGDVAGVIACTRPETGIDLYMGTGGAPEGVLAAAALRCIGGQFQGRLLFNDDEQRARAKRMGVEDLDKIYTMEELASGDVMFAATGVTDGWMLGGVQAFDGGAITQSMIMRSTTGTVRIVEAEHNFTRKTWVSS